MRQVALGCCKTYHTLLYWRNSAEPDHGRPSLNAAVLASWIYAQLMETGLVPRQLCRHRLLEINRRHFIHNALRVAIALIRQDHHSEPIIKLSRYLCLEALPPTVM